MPLIMSMIRVGLLLCCALGLPGGCAGPAPAGDPAGDPSSIRFAHLGREGGDRCGFEALRRGFESGNPGYTMSWLERFEQIEAGDAPRVIFIQSGESLGTIESSVPDSGLESELTVGDIVLLRPGEGLRCKGSLAALVFSTPDPLPEELPGVIRPDWDPRITDTPGGCAEEEGAYRRILLTWLPAKGPYVYRSLNAHRVRIRDSFSHYHPLVGGFDELYLVQMAGPDARVLTSERVERILDPGSVTRAEAASLLDEHPLAVGDLVYLPRGTMHRGVGGALVQVLSVPGFRPNAEVGLDHHLRAINERFDLTGDEALPVHESASTEVVIR
jgi:hypothetical protein